VRLMPVPDNFLCPISAAIMVDPVATVDGCVYERQYIERWFRERRQQGCRISSPITGLELPSATLMPLVALQRAIEVYLAHRPELKREHMAGRSFEEAAQILQTDLFEKQAVHATAQDKLKRMKQTNKALAQALHEAEARIMQLERERQMDREHHFAGVGGSSSSTSGSSGGSSSSDAAQEQKHGDTLEHHRFQNISIGFMAKVPCPGLFATAAVLLLLTSLASMLLLSPATLHPDRASISSSAAPVPNPSAIAVVSDTAYLASPQAGDELHCGETITGRSVATDNPALVGQVEHLRTGSVDEKQRAVFMLRMYASEQAENQVAIACVGAVMPLIALLQDSSAALREEAARALWNLARNNKEINLKTQKAIGQAGAVLPLVRLLKDDVPRVRIVAAAVLNDLATDNIENQIAVARAGAIDPLVRLLRDEEAPALVMAASLLKSLAGSNSDRDLQVAAALSGAVQPLVALLHADTLLAQEQAASTLGVLAAYSREIQVAIAQAGAIGPLVERLRGDMMQGTAALALRNLASGNPENQAAIVQAGAILPLVKLLEDGMPGVREEAARALWNLAMNNFDNQVAIVRSGAAIPLVALLKGDAQEQATISLLNVGGVE